MPILMTADVPGQTREGYHRVFDALAPLYAAAPGFVAHLSHPIDDGWCVMDVWQTREDFERFSPAMSCRSCRRRCGRRSASASCTTCSQGER